MYSFVTNRTDIYNDLFDVIRLFVPFPESTDLCINHTYIKSNIVKNFIKIDGNSYCFKSDSIHTLDALERTRLEVREVKLSLYKALSDHFKRCLPWGSLTGIRPTKLAYQLLNKGTELNNVAAELEKSFLVSEQKAQLVQEIISNQFDFTSLRMNLVSPYEKERPLYDQRLINLYIHIPFCISKCHYCSFVSTTIDKQKWLVAPYVDALVNEIEQSKQMIDDLGYRVFSVYIGGGTPTALSAEQLAKILATVQDYSVEITCEAGRPDTITAEKLEVMYHSGVNRISVNPQTLSNETLLKIGRNHTTQQFYEAYAAAQKYGFKKNIDLIAGLSDETIDDFIYSVDEIIRLKPENITVHTLSRKRGSLLVNEQDNNKDIDQMVDYSISALSKSGYLPYYLYRQKQMHGNLENIGWSLPNHLCVNNVTVMEEFLPVMACGAGAINKRMFDKGRIERLANPKDVLLYLQQFEERLAKKRTFYKN